MKQQLSNIAPVGESAAASTRGFITEKQILPLVTVSPRTLANWRRRKLIPWISMPGSRRVLYDWDQVRAAILRQQRGGIQ
jgi:hypothetical protein